MNERTLYRDLRRRLEEIGAFRPAPIYYATWSIFWSTMFAGGAAIAFQGSMTAALASSAALAFTGAQLAFLGHDLAHHQAFRSRRLNHLMGATLGAALLGMSYRWWQMKHNRHHVHPNHEGKDPDLDTPLLTLVPHKPIHSGLSSFLRHYQPIFFFVLILFAAIGMTVKSFRFAIATPYRGRCLEAILLFVHVLALTAVAVALPWGWLVIILSKMLFGAYLSVVFATNHKGMPVLVGEEERGVLSRQLLTTRNLRAHWLVDFLVGPLGAQIDHHLFPSIPRNRLRASGRIIREFCACHGLAYYETNLPDAFREVMAALVKYARPPVSDCTDFIERSSRGDT